MDLSTRRIAARRPFGGAPDRAAAQDALTGITLSHIVLPLENPLSDAKVLTGRQSPLSAVDILACEAVSENGHRGMGFAYTLRAGGSGMFALACEVADRILSHDPNDIGRLWERLRWQTNSLGQGGMSYQTIGAFDTALWDMKARAAGLPLAKLLGAHHDSMRIYNSQGQYLQASVDEMKAAADRSIGLGIGGIKMKVGQPDGQEDLKRIQAMRDHLPDHIAFMVDANQQWDRAYALQFGRIVDEMGLAFIEEPLDALDFEGHADLARNLATPIATGEMLTSPTEAIQLAQQAACDVSQVDALRIGGVTPFLKAMAMAEAHRIQIAPHWLMELHVHLAAAFPEAPWIEHFHWLEPLFDERLDIADGRVAVPTRPGLGLTLSSKARDWTVASQDIGEGGRP
ncbi:mandelate racemase/muconate lactonizing enzyme family protein [Psychromarinibacter sp. C21-152]|uniref:Mandelate racemase/muconate lactonizing enzyme family protein n=1 Tax=Psychromarinibacter sediminicola TaxID=3033385 RepID=A0AAE3NWK9_9RHOB|nr:mandelate racemase/muconate lactonizing enzyme family protein [Psychromarinibacter sediminicola]MDF0601967.1 mandelate racemase/muconate lactonizing enzyme family protein [Psychromarinibacter sediminicola]